ncbi:hypothetical protein MCY_00191, partial [Bartonella rattimassiliensis 15908]
MKKLIIVIIMSTFLGTSSLAQQPPAASDPRLTDAEKSLANLAFFWANLPPGVIETLEKRHHNNKTLRELFEKIHKSMTDPKITKGKLYHDHYHNFRPYDDDDFFLKNPQNIYNNRIDATKEMNKMLTTWIENVKYFEKMNGFKPSIASRAKFLGMVDKAVSFQAFKNIKNRFNELKELEEKINKTKDL